MSGYRPMIPTCRFCGCGRWTAEHALWCSNRTAPVAEGRSFEALAAGGAPEQAAIRPIQKRGGYQPNAEGPPPTAPPQRSDSRRSASPAPEQATGK